MERVDIPPLARASATTSGVRPGPRSSQRRRRARRAPSPPAPRPTAVRTPPRPFHRPSPRSTPDMRVSAVNGTRSAPRRSRRGGHNGPWRAPRSTGLRASRRRGWRAPRRGRAGPGDVTDREEHVGLPVAEGDGAGLVEQQHAVARRLDHPATHRQHVAPTRRSIPAIPIAESTAPTSWGSGTPAAPQDDRALLGIHIDGEGLQRDRGEHEDDHQGRQAGCSAQIILRLLPLPDPPPTRSCGR